MSKPPTGEKRKKSKNDGNFDSLDEKVADISLDEKPKIPTDTKWKKSSMKALKQQKPSTQSLNITEQVAKQKTDRSNSLEKDSNSVVSSLYDAASVMCNIVDVTKDSTMRGLSRSVDLSNPAIRAAKFASAKSQSQSGPFSSLKEQEAKKKKSPDSHDE